MDAAVWGFVGVIAGAVVGAVASIATSIVSARNAASLQAVAHSLEREERSRAFQRENLLAVQDVLQDLGRLTGRAHHEDVMAHRSGTEWGRNMLSAEVDEGLGLANRRLTALVERIADDSLRSEIRQLHSNLTWQAMTRSEEEAQAYIAGCLDEYTQAMSHLGEVLRNHY